MESNLACNARFSFSRGSLQLPLSLARDVAFLLSNSANHGLGWSQLREVKGLLSAIPQEKPERREDHYEHLLAQNQQCHFLGFLFPYILILQQFSMVHIKQDQVNMYHCSYRHFLQTRMTGLLVYLTSCLDGTYQEDYRYDLSNLVKTMNMDFNLNDFFGFVSNSV